MHPMLTDFGIARLADSPGLTRTHEFVGHARLCRAGVRRGPPADLRRRHLRRGDPAVRAGHRAARRSPGGTALEVLHRHLSEEPRRPTTVPAPLWTVIERCLSKDPERRPSAENLARGLRVVAAGIGVHSTPAQVEAADGVGALLAPDPAPAPVPDAPGAADPTQVLPSNAASYDPAARTSVLPQTGQGPARRPDRRHAAGPAGAAPAAGTAPLAVPAPGGPRPQRADPGRLPAARPGPAAPPPAPPAAAPAGLRPAGRPAAAGLRRQQPASRATASSPPQGHQRAAPAPAADAHPAGATSSRSSTRRRASSTRRQPPAAAAAGPRA